MNKLVALEETHYYPFGLTMAGISSKALNNVVENKYKFNGGSELNSTFDVNIYETLFRGYDYQTGRFHQIDPLAEITPSWGAYAFVQNNPLLYSDPFGLDTIINNEIYQWDGGYMDEIIINMPSSGGGGDGFFGFGWGTGTGQSSQQGNMFPMPGATASTGWGGQERVGQDQQQKRGGSWDATNITLGAFGLANGVKLTMLEGGAALNRGMSISKVNNISLIRTYGVAGAKYMKYAKGLGVAGSVVTTGYSVGKVIDQYNTGGWSEVESHRYVVDAGVGIIGLGATGLAAFGIISNPVGWGIGILIYGGATLIYDAVNND